MGRSSVSLGSDQGLGAPTKATEPAIGLPTLLEASTTELVRSALRRVLASGHRVEAERPSIEVLNQTLGQHDPRRRVLSIPQSSFNPAIAVARLVWHLSRSSDLAAIEFYEPRARRFSDDGKVLPGSDTGARLFGGRDGPDQVRGLISRIRSDPSSRRGMAVAWRPEDATRQSRDIPCMLALSVHLRGDRLLTTVSMRSNNALRLLPYNLFEFTMLAELIATELDVELGSYWHTVNSLHVFEEELDIAAEIAAPTASSGPSEPMPSMPHGESPFRQVALLVEAEAQLRAVFSDRAWNRLPPLLARAEANLDPYWLGLFVVLAHFCSTRAGVSDLLDDQLIERIPGALRVAPPDGSGTS